MEHYSISYLYQKRKRLMQQFKQLESCMLRGSLIVRYKKCGKSNCRCINDRGHGPSYYLSVSMPGGMRPIMVYISMDIKSVVEKAIKNFQKAHKIGEDISNINRELLLRKKAF